MPDIRDVATQRAIADAYITNGAIRNRRLLLRDTRRGTPGETRTVWLQIVACRP